MQNYLQKLQQFGLIKLGDNVRLKPALLYDTATIAAGTTNYDLFVNPALAAITRNKILPLSGYEVFYLDKVAAFLNISNTALTANLAEAFTRSYLQITVNDREFLKIPLFEILCAHFTSTIGANTLSYKELLTCRSKKLQFPIILNSTSNVQANLVLSANAATALNTGLIRLEFTGVKFDKMSAFNFDEIQGRMISRSPYTMYDSNAIWAAAGSTDLFSTRNKADVDLSKAFPLSDRETFSIEAIETMFFSRSQAFNTALAELRQTNLTITVNDVEVFNGGSLEMHSLLNYNAGNFTDADDADNTAYTTFEYKRGGLILPEPILVPGTAIVKVNLSYVAPVALTDFYSVALKGTLQRGVA